MKSFLSRKSALLSIGLMLIVGCSNDETPNLEVDSTNPEAVSKALIIENSTFLTGSLPIQSADPAAPVLDTSNDGKPLFSIQGSKIIITVEIIGGNDPAGFYLNVNGSNGYFKIESTTSTGRLKGTGFVEEVTSSNYPSFSIEIPKSIKPGEFCVSYSVFDATGLVSNIINQCIIINQTGGAGSEFLTTNSWSFVKTEFFYQDSIWQTYEAGIGDVRAYSMIIPCDTSFINVTVEYIARSTYGYYTFQSNGIFELEDDFYEKSIDYPNSNCSPLYKEITRNDEYNGSWSYDNETGTLTFLYTINGDNGPYTMTEQYHAELINNELILSLQYDSVESAKVTLIPK